MSAEVDFYIAHLVAHARSLPLSDAVPFLAGALELAGERAEMEDVKRAHRALIVADDQLELIAGGPGK